MQSLQTQRGHCNCLQRRKDFSSSSILQKDTLPGEMYPYISHSTLGLLLRETKAALAMPPAMLEDPDIEFWWLFWDKKQEWT